MGDGKDNIMPYHPVTEKIPDKKVADVYNQYAKIVHEIGKLNKKTIKSIGNYYGQLKDNKYHGKGILTEAKSAMYFGNFKNGEKEGLGAQHIIFDQEIYVGEFKNNKFDGEGTFFTLPKKQKLMEVTYQMVIRHYPSLISYYEGIFSKGRLVKIYAIKFGVDRNWETFKFKTPKKINMSLSEMKKDLKNVEWTKDDFS